MLQNPLKKTHPTKDLFDIVPTKYKLPQLTNTWLDDAFDEIELFGFSLCSPFKLVNVPISTQLKASDLYSRIGQVVDIVGYLVNIKTVRTIKGDKMNFGTFIDLDGYWIDSVHFPPSAKAFPFKGPGCYHLKGKVTEEFDYMALDIIEMHRLDIMNRDDVEISEPQVA